MTIQCRKKNQHNQNMNYIWDNNENLKKYTVSQYIFLFKRKHYKILYDQYPNIHSTFYHNEQNSILEESKL